MRTLKLALFLLMGCPTADDDVDPSGGSDSEQTGDTEPTGDTEDTAITWQVLDGACEAPTTLPDDPIALSGEVRLTPDEENFFAEIIDVHDDGDVMYAVGQGGLMIFDIATPTPELLGKYARSNGLRYHKVEPLSEGWLATTHRDHGLYIFDVSDRTDPQLVWQQDSENPDGIEGLAYDEPYLYVTSRADGLLVYDISEPESPEVLETVAGLEATWELAPVVDGWTYAADNDQGVVPIDLSDPTKPVLGTPVALDGPVLHVDRWGDYLLASAGSAGMVVMSLEEPSTPTVVSVADTGGSVVMAAGEGALAVAVDHESIVAFDLSDPTNPVAYGRQVTEQFALAVELDGTQAWVGDWNLFEGYAIDTAAIAGELDTSQAELLMDPTGEVDLVRLSNRGAGTLTLSSVTADSETLALEVSTDALEPGESGWLRVTYTPESLDTAEPTELAAMLCIASDDPDDPTTLIPVSTGDDSGPVGNTAPDFTLQGLDGTSYTLSEHLGTPVLLAYFATW